eukprot:TRINITY_DN4685_c0_g1_i2.p1 TRINITY_DN4685_c0_g1~~TRINITY_DN4685_c0_g1_i2.p1  ORF type:complete len:458 (+),score=104.33 TRINITY_DN4685_c0_g1_i2:40-1413(+)
MSDPHHVLIIREILATEQRYVQSLLALEHVYHEPLRIACENRETALAAAPVLRPEELRSIFSIVAVITKLHQSFVASLEKEIQQRGETASSVLHVFREYVAQFRMYSGYCSNYPAALSTLASCIQKRKSLGVWLQERRELPEAMRMDMQSLLIMPVQRLPRYVLLLTDLAKRLPQEEKNAKVEVERVLGEVKAVTDMVNESQRDAENALKVMQVQEKLTGKKNEIIMTPARRFIGEGECTHHQTSEIAKRRHYFIFNDALLLTSPDTMPVFGSNKLKFVCLIPMQHVRFIPQQSPDQVRIQTPVQYTISSGSPKYSSTFNLQMPSQQDKDTFTNAVIAQVDAMTSLIKSQEQAREAYPTGRFRTIVNHLTLRGRGKTHQDSDTQHANANANTNTTHIIILFIVILTLLYLVARSLWASPHPPPPPPPTHHWLWDLITGGDEKEPQEPAESFWSRMLG